MSFVYLGLRSLNEINKDSTIKANIGSKAIRRQVLKLIKVMKNLFDIKRLKNHARGIGSKFYISELNS